MGFVLMLGGIWGIWDAFSAHHFATRQEWEIGVGIMLLLIGAVIEIISTLGGD